MRHSRFVVAALALLSAAPAVLAQATYPTVAGSRVNGVVPLQCDTNGANCAPASQTNVPPALPGSTSTDRSGTITLGGTYQTILAADTSRKGCLFQNPTTATEIMSLKVGTMASPFTIAAGSTFNCASNGVVVTDTITATAATTSHAFAGVSQ